MCVHAVHDEHVRVLRLGHEDELALHVAEYLTSPHGRRRLATAWKRRRFEGLANGRGHLRSCRLRAPLQPERLQARYAALRSPLAASGRTQERQRSLGIRSHSAMGAASCKRRNVRRQTFTATGRPLSLPRYTDADEPVPRSDESESSNSISDFAASSVYLRKARRERSCPGAVRVLTLQARDSRHWRSQRQCRISLALLGLGGSGFDVCFGGCVEQLIDLHHCNAGP